MPSEVRIEGMEGTVRLVRLGYENDRALARAVYSRFYIDFMAREREDK